MERTPAEEGKVGAAEKAEEPGRKAEEEVVEVGPGAKLKPTAVAVVGAGPELMLRPAAGPRAGAGAGADKVAATAGGGVELLTGARRGGNVLAGAFCEVDAAPPKPATNR